MVLFKRKSFGKSDGNSSERESLILKNDYLNDDGSIKTFKEIYPSKTGKWLRCLKWLIYSQTEDYRAIKMILGIPVGGLLGYVLYTIILRKLKLPDFASYALLGLLITFFGVGFGASSQVRCITLLIIPTFAGKEGRGFISSLAFAELVSGPIGNIILNSEEVLRSVTCSNELSANLTKSRLGLMMSPLKDIMSDLQNQGETIHNATAQVKKEFGPMAGEISDESETEEMEQETKDMDEAMEVEEKDNRGVKLRKKYKEREKKTKGEDGKTEVKYEKKLDFKCEDVWTMAVASCRAKFKEHKHRCKKKLKIVSFAFCWPFSLSKVCELIRMIPKLAKIDCDSMGEVNPGFGEEFNTADKSSKALDEQFDVNMQYQIVSPEEMIQRLTVDEITKKTKYEFNKRKVWLNFFLSIVSRVVGFLFLRVISGATKYHKNYVTDFKFNNNLITPYFHHIEKRRRIQGKPGLLPLKKLEKVEIKDISKLAMSKIEKTRLVKGIVNVLLRSFTFALVFLVDRFIYSIMRLIETHSKIDFEQKGEHSIKLTIYGNGVLGKLIRSVLKGFNVKHSIEGVHSNFECLPKPSKLGLEKIASVYAFMLVLVVLCAVEALVLRYQRVLCAYFYPKREKRRILYLYNDLLKKRRGFLRHTRHIAKRKARRQQLETHVSVWLALRRQWPRLCGCIKAVEKKKCLICGEPENKNFHDCTTENCNFTYCAECWEDIEHKCYACREAGDWSSDSEITEDDDEDNDAGVDNIG